LGDALPAAALAGALRCDFAAALRAFGAAVLRTVFLLFADGFFAIVDTSSRHTPLGELHGRAAVLDDRDNQMG
jgi:hypothetical protein